MCIRDSHEYARHLGKALQLTNILRDVKNDAARGRIYLPQDELKTFGVNYGDIMDSRYSERYYTLAANIAARARKFYRLAGETLPPEDRKAMVAAELMGCVYWRLLRKLEHAKFNVFGARPLKISKPHKLALVAQAWLGHASGWQMSNYGRP